MALWLEKLLCMGEGQGIDYARLAELGAGTGGRTGVVTWEGVHQAMLGLSPEQRTVLYLRPNPARISGEELAAFFETLWLGLIGFEAKRRTQYEGEITDAIRDLLTTADAARDVRQARMVQFAVAEFIDTKLCRACAGSREEGKVASKVEGVVGLIYATCQVCDGRTWIPWSDNRRASLIGGTREHWRKRHEPGYLHVLQSVKELHREGAELFKHRLFGPVSLESKLQARA